MSVRRFRLGRSLALPRQATADFPLRAGPRRAYNGRFDARPALRRAGLASACLGRIAVFDSVAVVGATGAVGTIIRQLLESRSFPFKRIKFLASARSAGKTISFAGEHVHDRGAPARGLRRASNWPSAARRTRSRGTSSPRPSSRGCVVVDESGYWRMDPKVPLVIPEVNAARHLAAPGDHRQPELLDHADGRGDEAAARLRPGSPRRGEHVPGGQRGGAGRQPRPGRRHPGLLAEKKPYRNECFPYPIAFNCIPQIGSPKHKGYTSEEMKMVHETRKMFERRLDPGLPDLRPRAGGQLPQREHPRGDGAEDQPWTRPGGCLRPRRASA